jgi:hypothetical protein
MVGIIHPCKVYGAMAVAKPVLYFGPNPSHIADLLRDHNFGWPVRHGDVSGAIETIKRLRAADPAELRRMGKIAQRVLGKSLSQELLCGRMCDGLVLVFAQ